MSCWSLAIQNVGIHYASVHKIPEGVLPCFDWEVANITFYDAVECDIDNLLHSFICCTVECFVADLLGLHYDLIYCLHEQHFLDLNL